MGKAEGNTPKQMKRVPRFVISGSMLHPGLALTLLLSIDGARIPEHANPPSTLTPTHHQHHHHPKTPMVGLGRPRRDQATPCSRAEAAEATDAARRGCIRRRASTEGEDTSREQEPQPCPRRRTKEIPCRA